MSPRQTIIHFRVGNEVWKFCREADCEDCEPASWDYESALAWLRRFKDRVRLIRELRRALGDLEFDPVHREDDDDVLERIAWAFHSRRLRACRKAGEIPQGGAELPEPKVVDQEELGAAPARRKKTWVEFAVIDMEGKPVSNKKYLVMLPDGSIHEGMLDSSGRLRFDGIDPENSVFSLPDLDQDAWERVS